jgi:putative oxidoreductase
MTPIVNLYDHMTALMQQVLGGWFLPTLARFTFAAVLLVYFWNSAKTKLGDGFFGFLHPNENAFMQVFPQKMATYGYDISAFGGFDTLVVTTGTLAEFLLPLLIVTGLFTRIAAIGMVGFVAIQTQVDIFGHMVGTKTIGAWFDGPSNSLIMDQRLLWMVVFAILLVKGAGPLSLDRLLRR